MDIVILENLAVMLGCLLLFACGAWLIAWIELRLRKRKPETTTWMQSELLPMPGMQKIDHWDGCLISIIGDLKVIEEERKEIHE